MGARQAGCWDGTLNVAAGCSTAGPGCFRCYAEPISVKHEINGVALYTGVTERRRGGYRFNGVLTVLEPDHPGWIWPLTWPGAKHPVMGEGQPSIIFVGDMADLFIEGGLSGSLIALLRRCSPRATSACFSPSAPSAWPPISPPLPERERQRCQKKLWLGFSAERQKEFEGRWPHMRALAALLGISQRAVQDLTARKVVKRGKKRGSYAIESIAEQAAGRGREDAIGVKLFSARKARGSLRSPYE
jgi:Protein of unknown function (DUF5131)